MKLRLSFSLRTLLVLVTLSAVAVGWHTHRQRIINAERAKLLGTWRYGLPSGDGWADDGDQFEMSETDIEVGTPSGGIGTIDFHMPDGSISPAIYRFRDGFVEFAQSNEAPRPTTFDEQEATTVWRAKRTSPATEQRSTKMTTPNKTPLLNP